MAKETSRLKQKVKMSDIAKLAGVSKAAVSKALNNKPDISEKLKLKIFKICEDFDYRINFRIKDMVKERRTSLTDNIAFLKVGSLFSDPAYAPAIDGITKGAAEYNLRLYFERLNGDEKLIYELPSILKEERVDGFIITGNLNPSLIKLLAKTGIPFVILGKYSPELLNGQINFAPNLKVGMFEIINELQSKGKKKLAFFSETFESFYDKILKHLFLEAISAEGMNFENHFIFKGTGHYSGAFDTMKEMFSSRELPFDAVVCMDFRCAQDIAFLAYNHAKIFSCEPITIATNKYFTGYELRVPAIFFDAKLSELAYQSFIKLLNIIHTN